MLRTLIVALALVTPGLAVAEEQREQFPRSAVNAEVRGHNGMLLGRVETVELDRRGNLVAAEIPGLEPADAPAAPALVADSRGGDDRVSLVNARRDEAARVSSGRTRAR